jgi:hypothetical protein
LIILAPALGRVKIGGAGPEDAPYVNPGRDGAAPDDGPALELGVPSVAAGFLVKGREKFIMIDDEGSQPLRGFPNHRDFACVLSLFLSGLI